MKIMTKRLFAYAGLSLLGALTVVFYFGVYGAVFLCTFALVLLFAGFVIKGCSKYKTVFTLVSAVLIASALYSIVYTNFIFEPKSNKYDGKTVSITAKVNASPRFSYNLYYYELVTSRVNNNHEEHKILLQSVNELDAEFNDTIKFRAVLTKCDNNYYKSKDYRYLAKSDEYYLDYSVVKAKDKGIRYIPIYIQKNLEHAVSVLIPGDEGDLCNAIALGDKYGMSRDLYSQFSKTGLSYIIVVSGMHMSIVASFILFILKPLRKRKITKIICCLMTILVISLYMAITGFSSSTVRSGIMIIISLLGSAIARKSDVLNNIGIAAILLTIINPYSVGDVGMLLSFAAVLGIVTIHPQIIKKFNNRFNTEVWYASILRYVFGLMSISVSAVIAVSPLTLMFFGVCNPLVIISSMFISPFVSFLMIFSLAGALLWYVPVLGAMAYPFALLAYFIAKWIITVVNFVSKIPYVQIFANPLYMQIWFGITLVIIGVSVLFRNKKKMACFACVFSLLILAGGYAFSNIINSDKVKLKILNSGKGTTAVLTGSQGTDILACGGEGTYTSDVVSELKYIGNSINFMLIPSTRNQECRYGADIMQEFDVNGVLLYYKYSTNEAIYQLANACNNYAEFSTGDTVKVNLVNGVNNIVMNVNNHTWQYVYSDNISVLIAPYGGKCWEVPKEYRNVDVLVANDVLEDLDAINYGEAIWSSSETPPALLKNYTATGDGTVTIKMK